MKTYLLDKNKKPYRVEDLRRWAATLEEQREVKVTDVVADITVSTLFLGIDHNRCGKGDPILFETMIFTLVGTYSSRQCRYATYHEALTHYDRICEIIYNREVSLVKSEREELFNELEKYLS